MAVPAQAICYSEYKKPSSIKSKKSFEIGGQTFAKGMKKINKEKKVKVCDASKV
jgi:hypothetical protein